MTPPRGRVIQSRPRTTGGEPTRRQCSRSHKRAVDAIFSIRIRIPKSFRPDYNPPTRPDLFPTLLKPGQRRIIQKHRNPKHEPVQHDNQPTRTPNPARGLSTRTKQTPEQRKAYEKARSQTPERKELHRKKAQQRRQRTKALGLCRDCMKPAIPDQTKCEACAEKHRIRRRKDDAERRARRKAERELTSKSKS